MNGINLIQKLEMQNLYINLKNHLKLKNLKKKFFINAGNSLEVKLLSCLSLQFSHLNEHNFRLGFNDMAKHMCPCGTEVKTNGHFLLHYHCVARGPNSSIIFDPSFSKIK